jgi:carboxylesterase type B
MMENGRDKSYDLAIAMDCPNQNHHEMLECLRKVSVRNLALFAAHYQPFLYNPFTPFGVTVEKNHNEAFLNEHPLKSLKQGNVKKLNWILTQVQDEGLYPASEFYDDNNLKNINDQWMSLAPFLFDYNSTTNDQDFKDDVSRKIRKEYLQDEEINKKTYPKLLQVEKLY